MPTTQHYWERVLYCEPENSTISHFSSSLSEEHPKWRINRERFLLQQMITFLLLPLLVLTAIWAVQIVLIRLHDEIGWVGFHCVVGRVLGFVRNRWGELRHGSCRWFLGLLCNEEHQLPWVCWPSDGWKSDQSVSRWCDVPWKVCQLFLAPAMTASSFTGSSHNGVEGIVKCGGTKVMYYWAFRWDSNPQGCKGKLCRW